MMGEASCALTGSASLAFTRGNYSDRVEPVPFHEPSWERSTFNAQR